MLGKEGQTVSKDVKFVCAFVFLCFPTAGLGSVATINQLMRQCPAFGLPIGVRSVVVERRKRGKSLCRMVGRMLLFYSLSAVVYSESLPTGLVE